MTLDTRALELSRRAPPSDELTAREQRLFDRAIAELVQRKMQRRIDLLDLFTDFDRSHRQAVTPGQFNRVMKMRGVRQYHCVAVALSISIDR